MQGLPNSKQYSVLIIKDINELKKYQNDWNNLVSQTETKLATSSYAWIVTSLEKLTFNGEEWFCLLAFRDKVLVGVMPLVLTHKAILNIDVNILTVPYNSETLGVIPLVDPVEYNIIYRLLINTAWRIYPDTIYIEIRDAPENAERLMEFSGTNGLISFHRIGRYLPLAGDYDDYLKSLSKNFKSNLKKAANKIVAFGNVSTKIIPSTDDYFMYFNEFMPMESSGWKGREGTAILSNNYLKEFYTILVERLMEADWLEWHFLQINEQSVACNMAIHFNRSILIWKLAYDEAFSKCSPGGMLFHAILDHYYNNPDIDEINLLTDADWYDNWNMAHRKYYQIQFFNYKSLRSVLFGYMPSRLLILIRRYPFLHKYLKKIVNKSPSSSL